MMTPPTGPEQRVDNTISVHTWVKLFDALRADDDVAFQTLTQGEPRLLTLTPDQAMMDGITVHPRLIVHWNPSLNAPLAALRYRALKIYNVLRASHRQPPLAAFNELESLNHRLAQAILTGNLEATRQHIAEGAKVTAFVYDQCILNIAIAGGNLEIVTVLLNNDALRTPIEASHDKPVHVAAASPIITILMLLSTCGANLEATSAMQRTPLHVAAATANVDAIIFLLAQNVNYGARDTSGNTPLHLVVREGRNAENVIRIVERLAQAGTPVDVVNNEGKRAIDYTSEMSVIETFLRLGVSSISAEHFLSCSLEDLKALLEKYSVARLLSPDAQANVLCKAVHENKHDYTQLFVQLKFPYQLHGQVQLKRQHLSTQQHVDELLMMVKTLLRLESTEQIIYDWGFEFLVDIARFIDRDVLSIFTAQNLSAFIEMIFKSSAFQQRMEKVETTNRLLSLLNHHIAHDTFVSMILRQIENMSAKQKKPYLRNLLVTQTVEGKTCVQVAVERNNLPLIKELFMYSASFLAEIPGIDELYWRMVKTYIDSPVVASIPEVPVVPVLASAPEAAAASAPVLASPPAPVMTLYELLESISSLLTIQKIPEQIIESMVVKDRIEVIPLLLNIKADLSLFRSERLGTLLSILISSCSIANVGLVFANATAAQHRRLMAAGTQHDALLLVLKSSFPDYMRNQLLVLLVRYGADLTQQYGDMTFLDAIVKDAEKFPDVISAIFDYQPHLISAPLLSTRMTNTKGLTSVREVSRLLSRALSEVMPAEKKNAHITRLAECLSARVYAGESALDYLVRRCFSVADLKNENKAQPFLELLSLVLRCIPSGSAVQTLSTIAGRSKGAPPEREMCFVLIRMFMVAGVDPFAPLPRTFLTRLPFGQNHPHHSMVATAIINDNLEEVGLFLECRGCPSPAVQHAFAVWLGQEMNSAFKRELQKTLMPKFLAKGAIVDERCLEIVACKIEIDLTLFTTLLEHQTNFTPLCRAQAPRILAQIKSIVNNSTCDINTIPGMATPSAKEKLTNYFTQADPKLDAEFQQLFAQPQSQLQPAAPR
jgi:ankyrin repeat protein